MPALGFIWLMLCAAATCADDIAVIGSRLWHGPDRTRLVLELSGPVDYKVFSLEDPNRVVIDLKHAHLGGAASLPIEGGGPIKRVRTGNPSVGVLRLVLDLLRPRNYRAFLLSPSASYPHRLVIDLTGTAPAATTSVDASDIREQDYLVVIDPGHGGEDPGAVGGKGSHEKQVVLEIASRLKRIINWDSRMRAVLTRTGDYYVSLRRRVAFAMGRGADIFISIHADAAKRRSAHGSSVYILSTDGASSELGKWLALRENAADLAGGVDIGEQEPILQKTLLDMGLDWKIRESRALGAHLLKALGKVGPLHSPNVERAGFAVLKSVDIPAVLVETGFMTNRAEEQALGQALVQERIAGAIFRGLSTYCDLDPRCPETVREADVYVVAPGDSLALIAARLGFTVADLKRINRLTTQTLEIGQKLTVPVR
ncbi:MAG: N-acetylmuramoyl-L-alanine amidase [Acidiferrobacteraceae bacterium]|nr:N-acetylmuramoyl-L-alanine amidase [Acidiferrobacteraceae bacterium]MDP6552428.1 N-acetylmuramoyl-L-alanine amidase [Arenicellales bacterium]MDP6790284.1 N-acetylmuramoyl-L-alanine amidase [Arenicellales bacterium]MDP6918242.1 N-acetylmuramoyl-L-alanine amidase [Arenicellales bacterium]|tara:strand:+ start:35948 stop:37228 length:1281 start_codon:yes stop_codon:yes gene_type:complete